MFNSREIATGIWLGIVALWGLSNPGIRSSVWRVVVSSTQPKILLTIVLMVAYTSIVVAILASVGMWHTGLLKDTIYWFCFSATALAMDYVTSKDNESVFRKIFFDNVKAILLVEFLVNFYTFPLAVELLLLPFMVIIVAVDTISRIDKKFAQVVPVTTTILGIVGLVVFGYSLYCAAYDAETLRSEETFRSLALTPLLSISFAPCIYGLLVWATYEDIFVRLRIGAEKPSSLVRYGKRQIMWHCGVSLKKLRELRRNAALELMRARTNADIDRILAEAR